MPARQQYVEPTVRWYHQGAANFFTPWLPGSDQATTRYVSADPRLATFHALTYGLKYGYELGGKLHRSSSEFTVRVEYYQQTLQIDKSIPVGLQGLDLYPGLKAVLVQFGFSY